MRYLTITITLVTVLSGTAWAQVPAKLPVQGFLTDPSGMAIHGAQAMTFALFDQKVDGGRLHSEVQVVEVAEGYFTAYIGQQEELDLSIFRDVSETYVEISVGTETLSPRLPMATVPYAAQAAYAGEAERLANGLSFSELLNVPRELLDGDDDTTYTAGEGIAIDGGHAIKIDPTVVQRRVTGACSADQAMYAVEADGTVQCLAIPEAPVPGLGIVNARGTWNADTSILQRRVGGWVGGWVGFARQDKQSARLAAMGRWIVRPFQMPQLRGWAL